MIGKRTALVAGLLGLAVAAGSVVALDLDALLAPVDEPQSRLLEEASVSAAEREVATQRNRQQPPGRSWLDSAGAAMGKSLAEGLARDRDLAGADYDRCLALVHQQTAHRACIRDTASLRGMGEAGLAAVYAIEGRCDLLAGIDRQGLYGLCLRPQASSCAGLNASQGVRDACYSCNGDNLWLRVYAAANVAVTCYL